MNRKITTLLTALLTTTLSFSACADAGDGPATASSPAATCLRAAAWTRLDGVRPQPATATSVIGDMAKRDVVLLGEQHDAVDDHRWQLQTLSALHALRPNMAIGFEMFPRRLQPVLDRWVAGELTARQFLEQTEWDKVWSLPAELYLPLFEFARMNRIPMLAINIDEKLSQAVAEKGWDAIPVDQREGVSRPAPPPEPYRDMLRELYRQHLVMKNHDGSKSFFDAHGGKHGVKAGLRYFVESQTTWDRAMAEALARRSAVAAADAKPLVVGIMGRGHVRYGYGVAHQLRDLGISSVGSLMAIGADSDCTMLRAGLADAVFALPTQAVAAAEPPRLGITLDKSEGKVSIAAVSNNSLAEKSGLKAGDRLLDVAGQPVKDIGQVTAAVKRQPGGTLLPLRILRGAETLDVAVKFPLQP